MLAQFVRPWMFEDVFLVHSQKDKGLNTDKDIVKLSSCDFSKQGSTLDFNEPTIFLKKNKTDWYFVFKIVQTF